MFEPDITEEKPTTKQIEYKSGVRFEGQVDGPLRNGPGTVYWPDGSRYDGEFKDNKRHGTGVYVYSDGSVYEGSFDDDMRHGYGELRHPNGEMYKGQFFRDACHGIGSYIWTNEEKIYTGSFYRDKLHGYGILSFGSGDRYEGMMRENDRFGPGAFFHVSQPPTVDVGLWLGSSLYRLCYEIPCLFSLNDYKHLCVSDSGWLEPSQISLSDDLVDQITSIRPVLQSMETYRGAVDISKVIPRVFLDHSVDNKSLAFDRARFDTAFYEGAENFAKIMSRGATSWITPKNATDVYVAMVRLSHHFEGRESILSFSPSAIFNGVDRSLVIGSEAEQGVCEQMAAKYIKAASEGDVNFVLDLFLDSGPVPLHPDVCDSRGNGALINAAVGGHLDMVDVLLNNGCNSNVVNDDCVTPLLACFTLYYPSNCFRRNLAENPPGIEKFEQQQASIASSRKTTKKEARVSPTRSRSNSPKKQRSPSPKKAHGSASPSKQAQQAPSTADTTEDRLDQPQSRAISKTKSSAGASKEAQSKPDTTKSAGGGKTKKGEPEQPPKEPKNHTFESPPQTPSLEPIGMDNIESQQSIANMPVEQLPPKVLERAATLLSENEYVTSKKPATKENSSKEHAVRSRAIEIAQHRQIGNVIELLLRRGANVNAGLNPMPCLLFAVRAADVEMVKRLLLANADPNAGVGVRRGGHIASLHIAVGLPGAEAVEVTTFLLNALADANCRASLPDYFLSNNMLAKMAGLDKPPLIELVREEWEHDPVPDNLKARCGGPTPLHVACSRDDDYLVAAHIVRLLLEHKADPDVICQGHSPLSLAICSGNDLAVDLLLSFGCNASLALTNGNGSALCVATNPDWEKRRSPPDRIKLLDKLIAAGADALAPVQVGPKRHTGTFVDFAYHMFNQDRRIAHTPFHALSAQERDMHTARKELLNHCGDLLRTAALAFERHRNRHQQRSRSPSADFVHTGTGADPHATRKEWHKSPLPIRKMAFHYCYQCGRTVGVRLTPCTRCKEVYYCSKNCKLTSWNIRHKDECMRVEAGATRGSHRAESPTPAIGAVGHGRTVAGGGQVRILVNKKAKSGSLEDLRNLLKKLSARRGGGGGGRDLMLMSNANAENNYSFN